MYRKEFLCKESADRLSIWCSQHRKCRSLCACLKRFSLSSSFPFLCNGLDSEAQKKCGYWQMKPNVPLQFQSVFAINPWALGYQWSSLSAAVAKEQGVLVRLTYVYDSNKLMICLFNIKFILIVCLNGRDISKVKYWRENYHFIQLLNSEFFGNIPLLEKSEVPYTKFVFWWCNCGLWIWLD